jgi:hypothetical protein
MRFVWRWIGGRNTGDVLRASKPMENLEQILGARNSAKIFLNGEETAARAQGLDSSYFAEMFLLN